MTLPHRAVEPLPGAVPYLGGKRNLARRLIDRLETIPHRCYAEPFVGAGGIFFRRRLAPTVEAINDRSRDVATFFRVLQRHYLAFLEMMRFQVTTRVEFERLVATDPSTLTDLERAARFYYLQRTAFGGKVSGRNFGVDPTTRARFDITRLAGDLEGLHERLAGVVIECLPFADFIRKWDRPGTLFFCDPPYWGCESDYGLGLFAREDFEQLAEQLGRLRGTFVLTLNDVPPVRALFKGFSIERVETTYTIANAPAKRVNEVVITPNRVRPEAGRQ